MIRNKLQAQAIREIAFNFSTLFPRSEERVDQRSVVGVSNRRNP
jgi:hypothetical protein